MNSPYLQQGPPANFGPSPGAWGAMDSIRQGASQNLQTLLAALAAHGEKQKQLGAEAKAADAWARTESGKSALAEIGLSPEQYANKSAAERVAIPAGYHQAIGMKKALLDQQAAQSLIGERQAQAAALQRAMESQQGFQRDYIAASDARSGAAGNLAAALTAQRAVLGNLPGMSGAAEAMQGVNPGELASVPPEQVLNLWLRNGGAPEGADGLIRAMQTAKTKPENQFFKPGDNPAQDLPDMPGYKRVVLGPNGSQLVYTGGNNPGQTVALTGPNGEQLGYGIPGKSGVTQIRTGDVTAQDQFKQLDAVRKEYLRNATQAETMHNAEAAKQWKAQAEATTQEMNALFKPAAGGAAGRTRKYNPATGKIE